MTHTELFIGIVIVLSAFLICAFLYFRNLEDVMRLILMLVIALCILLGIVLAAIALLVVLT